MTPVQQAVDNLFILAKSIDFRNGYDDAFRQGIRALVDEQGDDAISWIDQRIDQETKYFYIVEMVLRYLSEIEGYADQILAVLIKNLSHQSLVAKDGAALGLDMLGDLRAIPALQKAIDCEQDRDLKKDLQQVMDCLVRKSQSCGGVDADTQNS